MGVLEQDVAKHAKRDQIRKIILDTLHVASEIHVGLMRRNVFKVLDKYGLMPGDRRGELVNRALDRVVNRGYVKRRGDILLLTPHGARQLRVLENRFKEFHKPRRWDHKWRVLIFDVAETKRKLR